ncbi:hypothetical protein [Candidatus Lokiarchaeum ossiferum]|uniref:hypothetical protein n=1 Tax=Candidatus Lokiarchaeum ossiferum TaxID=2951803 RepID=UPI00352C007F
MDESRNITIILHENLNVEYFYTRDGEETVYNSLLITHQEEIDLINLTGKNIRRNDDPKGIKITWEGGTCNLHYIKKNKIKKEREFLKFSEEWFTSSKRNYFFYLKIPNTFKIKSQIFHENPTISEDSDYHTFFWKISKRKLNFNVSLNLQPLVPIKKKRKRPQIDQIETIIKKKLKNL